jgi:hypothetical protein
MKKLSILALVAILYSCTEDVKKYAVVCETTTIKYKDGILYSTEHKPNINHYSEFTAEQLEKLLTGDSKIKNSEGINWQVINLTTCEPFVRKDF